MRKNKQPSTRFWVMTEDDFDLTLEREKHNFMLFTVLYRSETKRQVLSKGRLLRYQTFGIPEDPEERKQVLKEERFWHYVMEHLYSETIEWSIVNVFRNHLRGHVSPQHGIVKAVKKRRKILMKNQTDYRR